MQFGQINKTSFIAGAGSVVLLSAALIPGLAGAQTATETPSATAEATGTASIEGVDCGPGLRGVFGLHVGEDLAAALGVTVEELQAAATEVREAYAGTERPATEEERDALKAEVQAAFATALGVTVEEIEAAKEQLQAEKQAAAIARVNEAVADGTITQERADALIERIESGERPFGRHGGRGFGGRGFGGGFPGGSSPSVTPDA